MKINKRGISLITLVITIIIMIILAAAIVLSLTQSGIFDKANDAVGEYNLKEAQAIAELAWAEAYADGARDEAGLQAAVNKALKDNDLDDKYKAKADEKGVTVTVKDPNAVTTLGELITSADDFGKTVDYTVTVDGTTYDNWQVYYKTDDYVFIASSDYIEGIRLSGKSHEILLTTPVKTLLQKDDKLMDLYNICSLGAYDKYDMGSYYDSEKVAIGLIADYNDFAYTDQSYNDYVVGAIGGPTLELLVAGYNAKHNTNITLTYDKPGWGDFGNKIDGKYHKENLITDELYLVKDHPYWLTLPCPDPHGADNNRVLVARDGRISCTEYFWSNVAVRPLVCLRADAPAKVTSDGNYTLVNETADTKPTVIIKKDLTANAYVGWDLEFVIGFTGGHKVDEISLTADDIILNGFTATKTITGDGNVRILKLTNMQGTPGNKTITVAGGVAKYISGGLSEETTSNEFELKAPQKQALGSLITSAKDYGKYVDYTVTVNEKAYNGWKVYYKTDDYVFLINADGNNVENIPNVTMSDLFTKTVSTLSGENNKLIDLYKIFTLGEPLYKLTEEYNGVKGLPRMIGGFSSFVNTDKYGNNVIGAIGGPTSELFTAVWNDMGNAPKITLSTNEYGYLYNGSEIMRFGKDYSFFSYKITGKTGYYFPFCSPGSDTSTSEGYLSAWFLAGASNTAVSSYSYTLDYARGFFLPVVCLKTSTPAVVYDSNTYSISIFAQ